MNFANLRQYERVTHYTNMDGVLLYLANNLPVKPFCVEFGCNADGVGNTSCLRWNRLLLDGTNNNSTLNMHSHYLTPDNIVDVFKLYEVPEEFGYLSVDCDTSDIWLCDSVLDYYLPTFFSCEYNPNFAPTMTVSWPRNSKAGWEGDSVFGSSLLAIIEMAGKHGYQPVYVGNYPQSAHDVIFVRKELVDYTDGGGKYAVQKLHRRASDERIKLYETSQDIKDFLQ